MGIRHSSTGDMAANRVNWIKTSGEMEGPLERVKCCKTVQHSFIADFLSAPLWLSEKYRQYIHIVRTHRAGGGRGI